MLEKQRESLAASKNYQKVKAHVQRNKLTYSCFGSAIASGLLVGVLKSRPTIVNNITQVTPSIAPVMNNISKPVFRPEFHNSNTSFVGHPHKLVKCLETEEIWETVKSAAEAVGKAPAVMSKHLNGHTDHVNGLHYKIIGLGTAADGVKAVDARTFILDSLEKTA
jgi:hypothetical protein